ncbi:MAG TPA: DNA/RNA nuclease SfsA [Thermaerobacter sp.]
MNRAPGHGSDPAAVHRTGIPAVAATRDAKPCPPGDDTGVRPPGRLATVPLPGPLAPVRLRRRLNRFAVEVEAAWPGAAAGRPLVLHLPNSGRMEELLQAGTEGRARLIPQPGRRTAGELLLVRYAGRWVSVDARMPNRLFAACLEAASLPPFAGYQRWQSEVRWGAGRIDFLLRRGVSPEASHPDPAGDGRPDLCLVETKSCNLVEDGVALFPDAPTLRGARHLEELRQAVTEGHRAAVVWFVQRDDASVLRPHRRADPAFARALAEAVAAGVEAYAYRCLVTPAAIDVLEPIPVEAASLPG